MKVECSNCSYLMLEVDPPKEEDLPNEVIAIQSGLPDGDMYDLREWALEGISSSGVTRVEIPNVEFGDSVECPVCHVTMILYGEPDAEYLSSPEIEKRNHPW